MGEHVPNESFILFAKRASLKFTLGTDARNQNAAHFNSATRLPRDAADRSRHVCAEAEATGPIRPVLAVLIGMWGVTRATP